MRLRLTLGILAVVLSGTPSRAQIPDGDEFVVNTYTTDRQFRPTVVGADGGGFLIFWEGDGLDGDHNGIFGRRYDAAGTPLGGEFQVNQYTFLWQYAPQAARADDGSMLVVWTSFMQDGDRAAVMARRYDGAGRPLGNEFQVNTYTTDRQVATAVASGGDGRFVVVWASYKQDGTGFGVFGQRLDALGNRLGDEFRVNKSNFADETSRSVAVGADGAFVVVWEALQLDLSGYDTFARLYDAEGNIILSRFRVNEYTTFSQRGAVVSFAPDGTFLVVWEGVGPGSPQSFFDVWARRYDHGGQPMGPEWRVNTYSSGAQGAPFLAMFGEGEYIVTWNSLGQDGDQWGIFGQRFSSSDQPVGPAFQINQYTKQWQMNPAVEALPDGQFVVTWLSHGKDGSEFGVVARRYRSDAIFADGFETGGLSRWSSHSGTAGGLEATPDAALKDTTFGLRARVETTSPLYVQDDSPDDEGRFGARFYFDPGAFDPGEAQGHFRVRVFIAFEESPSRRLLAVVLRRQSGQYGVMGRARLDDGSQVDTGFAPLAPGPHFVEVLWVRATGPGQSDGAFELWVDGALYAGLPDLDNDRSAVDFVRLGALALKPGASGTLRFDEFASRRLTPIGP